MAFQTVFLGQRTTGFGGSGQGREDWSVAGQASDSALGLEEGCSQLMKKLISTLAPRPWQFSQSNFV